MITATSIRERPILFSGPMVRAILSGAKTQTRRIVQYRDPRWEVADNGIDGALWPFFPSYVTADPNPRPCVCPYGSPGEHLWVRETWATDLHYEQCPPRCIGNSAPVWYQADGFVRWRGDYRDVQGKWRPSIFMPRWASRISLEITDIRVEPLQQITEADAQREGFEQTKHMLARRRFELLWGEINGKDSWAANPWVWVIDFQGVEARQ